MSLSFSHAGIFVRDLERMKGFYRDVLGLTETDRGFLGESELVFLTNDPKEHHQLVLATGRPESVPFNTVNQLSFRVADLSSLRKYRDRARQEEDVTDVVSVTHGNAISVYLRDPEGNRLELFVDTPWHCTQPVREPIDLDLPDDEVMAAAKTIVQSRAGFEERKGWEARLARRMQQD